MWASKDTHAWLQPFRTRAEVEDTNSHCATKRGMDTNQTETEPMKATRIRGQNIQTATDNKIERPNSDEVGRIAHITAAGTHGPVVARLDTIAVLPHLFRLFLLLPRNNTCSRRFV